MPEPTIVERIEILEQRVDLLETLPARMTAVELQLVQLRGEMQDGFSAVRRGIEQSKEELREEMRALNDGTQGQMRVLHEAVIARLALLQEGLPPRGRQPGGRRRR